MILRKFFLVIVVLALTMPPSASLGQDAADWPGPSAHSKSSSGNGIAAGTIGSMGGAIIGNRLSKQKRSGKARRGENQTVRNPSRNRGEINKSIQTALNAVGFNAGPADGVFGPKTHRAIKAFQVSIGQKPTGKLTALETSILFRNASPPPVYDMAPPEEMKSPALPENLPAMPKKLDFPPVQAKENSAPTDN